MSNVYTVLRKKYPFLFDGFLKSMGLTPSMDELLFYTPFYVEPEDIPLVHEYVAKHLPPRKPKHIVQVAKENHEDFLLMNKYPHLFNEVFIDMGFPKLALYSSVDRKDHGLVDTFFMERELQSITLGVRQGQLNT